MSFLTSRVPVLRAALTATPTARVAGVRSLSVSSVRSALSENEVHHENRGPEIDKHKHESVKNAKDGKGNWKPELASHSEAAVKADREEATGSKEDIKNLQKEGEKVGKQ